MSPAGKPTTRRVVYVCPRPTGESLRGAQAVKQLDGVLLLGICELPLPVDGVEPFADLMGVIDIHDSDQVVDAARTLSEKHGPLHQIVTAHETLLEPVARANNRNNSTTLMAWSTMLVRWWPAGFNPKNCTSSSCESHVMG